MRSAAITVCIALALAGCATAPPTNTVIVTCIPLKAWSDADQDQLRAEYDALPKDAKMRLAFRDYIAMRDSDKACKK
jgi:hypothetical protein